jgi:hypothetical protein
VTVRCPAEQAVGVHTLTVTTVSAAMSEPWALAIAVKRFVAAVFAVASVCSIIAGVSAASPAASAAASSFVCTCIAWV